MIEVINASSGKNSATERKIPNHVLTRSFDYGGAMYIIEKDLDLWRREAEAYEARCGLGTNIRTLFLQAMNEFGRDKDHDRTGQNAGEHGGRRNPKNAMMAVRGAGN